jgi:hypothetical protein
MRRLIGFFCNAELRSAAMVLRTSARQLACLVAVGGTLAVAQGFAKDPPQLETRPANKLSPSGAPDAKAAGMPECLEKLKLSQEQRAQAHEIVQKYDAKLDTVWKLFGEKYMETVRLEVALLSAIEDNLTEPQRTTVRAERRRVANAEKAMEGTKAKVNQAKEEPASPAEQAVSGAGIVLTPEQEDAADKVHEKYSGHLRSLNRDIQGIHNRLVSLEADKFVELEKLLTKEQLAELREHRQSIAAARKITAADSSRRITD